jgi:hypothetical protein
MRWLTRLFRKLDPLKEPLAALETRKEDAETELGRQRIGLEEERRQREDAQAEIERSIVVATRDVWRRRPTRR